MSFLLLFWVEILVQDFRNSVDQDKSKDSLLFFSMQGKKQSLRQEQDLSILSSRWSAWHCHKTWRLLHPLEQASIVWRILTWSPLCLPDLTLIVSDSHDLGTPSHTWSRTSYSSSKQGPWFVRVESSSSWLSSRSWTAFRRWSTRLRI